MKKLTVITILGLVLLSVAFAQLQDLTITIRIPAAKVQAYGKYFLLAYPNQTLNAKDPNDRLTNKQWVKYRVLLFARNAYKKGKRIEFEQQNQPTYDPNMVE